MTNRLYQKCPVCNGTGLVSTPPHIPGDQATYTDNQTGPYICKVCNGTAIIVTPYQHDNT